MSLRALLLTALLAFGTGASAQDAPPANASPTYTSTYIDVASVGRGDYLNLWFDEPGGTAVMSGLTIYPASGPGGLFTAEACAVPHGRCLDYPELFLPLVVLDSPAGAYDFPDLALRVNKQPTRQKWWSRANCDDYEEDSTAHPEFARQTYTWCPERGVMEIVTYTRKRGPALRIVLTSPNGLLA